MKGAQMGDITVTSPPEDTPQKVVLTDANGDPTELSVTIPPDLAINADFTELIANDDDNATLLLAKLDELIAAQGDSTNTDVVTALTLLRTSLTTTINAASDENVVAALQNVLSAVQNGPSESPADLLGTLATLATEETLSALISAVENQQFDTSLLAKEATQQGQTTALINILGAVLPLGSKIDLDKAAVEQVRDKLTPDPATNAKLDEVITALGSTGGGSGPTDGATETTLATLLNAVEDGTNVGNVQSLLKDIRTALANLQISSESIAINADSLNLNTDGVEALLTQVRDTLSNSTAKDSSVTAVKTSVDAVLAKLNTSVAVTGPLTDAQLRQTALTVHVDNPTAATDVSALATAAGQTAQKATQDAILAKLIAAPATEAKQDVQKAVLDALKTNSDKFTFDGSGKLQVTGAGGSGGGVVKNDFISIDIPSGGTNQVSAAIDVTAYTGMIVRSAASVGVQGSIDGVNWGNGSLTSGYGSLWGLNAHYTGDAANSTNGSGDWRFGLAAWRFIRFTRSASSGVATPVQYSLTTTDVAPTTFVEPRGASMPVNVTSGTVSTVTTVTTANVISKQTSIHNTFTPLAASGVFTGTGFQIVTSHLGSKTIRADVATDAPGGTVYIEWCPTSTGTYRILGSKVIDSNGIAQLEVPFFSAATTGTYLRMRIVNGTTAMTALNAYCYAMGA